MPDLRAHVHAAKRCQACHDPMLSIQQEDLTRLSELRALGFCSFVDGDVGVGPIAKMLIKVGQENNVTH
jgi:hypothetical protein